MRIGSFKALVLAAAAIVSGAGTAAEPVRLPAQDAMTPNPGWSLELERRCAPRDALACLQLAEALEQGRGTPRDPVKALAWYK